MKSSIRNIAVICSALISLSQLSIQAIEATWDFAVQVSAKVENSKITLSWPQDTTSIPNSYSIFRKSLQSTNWGQEVLLPGTATSYTDFNVSAGSAYEYQIVKSTPDYKGYGYIYAGIQAPAIENRGKIVLVVDNTYATQLSDELTRLQADLAGDGWVVLRHDVARNATVVSVKNLIKAEYTADPSNVQAVFLFGHVPVPYSGNIVPDGHYPDHQGAWPADAFYGDMDGNWTDTSVNNTSATEKRNRNTPGDGKFDQSEIPSTVELQVGRVDLANLPGKKYWNGPATFPNELELLRNYLNKDHAFRHKQLTAPARALIYDDFGFRGGEAFAASGYRNFSTFVGTENMITLTNKGQWIPVLQANNYLWAYGCGAGSYTSIGGLGNTGQYEDGTTIEMVESDVKAIFTLIMGSWLGDWDSEDNIMRSILATRTEGLISAWSGRPHWYCHPMALGLNMGYCARLTQNNGKNGPYSTQANSAAGQVHIALMGDPTLRMHVVGPASDLQVTPGQTGVVLTWNASSDAVLGYHVYRANTAAGPFTRLTPSLVTGTRYADESASGGTFAYMLRAVKLENTPSGSYYNLSQGIQAGTTVAGPILSAQGSSSKKSPVTQVTSKSLNLAPTGITTKPSNTGRASGAEGIVNATAPVVVTKTGSTNATDAVVTNAIFSTNLTSSVSTQTEKLTPTGRDMAITTTSAKVPVSTVDYVNLQLPQVGDNALHILSPTVLELTLINTKQPDAAVSDWDLVDSSSQFHAPANSDLNVLVDGKAVTIQSIGFKRRPLYAPLAVRDLRIENSLFLQIANPIADGQSVEVKNSAANLWPSSKIFAAKAEPLRFSPVIHVNQEGYVPTFPKKAMVGYFLGNLGELSVDASAGFKVVDNASGNVVFQGSLKPRPDAGYTYSPAPYTKVYEADFTSFNTPGEYRLMVPGLGASLPFLINDGIAMNFARAYALGLYHQRCGTDNVMPYTRFTHDPCHTAAADVPSPQSAFPWTWTTIANYTADYANFPQHTAPPMKGEDSQRFPFVNKGKIDVSGGHHDAGDYSKYTINSTRLIHYLMFAVDSFAGVADLDNLGLPESGDGISDVMQEAKWEADFLAKMQDADGGFYFLVYPQDREYESNVTPDQGDPQVVWPKTTSVTAASVAALAQCASSPKFKNQYPKEAALYWEKAQLGWKFLTNAIARYGKDGAYQKITHYGNEFIHDDELAWAAAEMFAATGDETYHQALKSWFDPADANTMRWGWWRMAESYGSAIRSYAFAARSGRLSADKLDAAYLAKCETQITQCAQEHAERSQKGAYGSSFPLESKSYRAAGWYFSSERAFDITVAYQLDPRPDFLEAIIANLNFEGGCNPVNVSYITGTGWKRQREIVHQYAQNDRRVMPPSGIPLGNIQGGFSYINTYKSELGALCFPEDGAATAPYPYYDRWADTFNVSTEFVNTDQARSLSSIAFLAALTPLKSQSWKPVAGQISAPTTTTINTPETATLQVPGMDLNGARILWEACGQEPAYGASYTYTPTNYGAQWIEAEVQWPDGRRVFAVRDAFANNNLPTVSVTATTANACETGPANGVWTFTRTGSTDAALTVNFKFSGTATKWDDFRRSGGDIPESIVIPAGAASSTFEIVPVADDMAEGAESATLTILPNAAYNLNQMRAATITITD